MSRLRLAGIAASGALVLLAVTLALVGGDGEENPASPDRSSRLVTLEELEGLEGTLGHPIYWAGEIPSRRLELAEEADGSIYLRYLPEGVAAGDARQIYLTVGTYPIADAQAALGRTAQENDTSLRQLKDGAVLLSNPATTGSAYLAFPGEDLQIEVYHPDPGRAQELIEAGAVKPVGE